MVDYAHTHSTDARTNFKGFLNKILSEAFYMDDDHLELADFEFGVEPPSELDDKLFVQAYAKPFT